MKDKKLYYQTDGTHWDCPDCGRKFYFNKAGCNSKHPESCFVWPSELRPCCFSEWWKECYGG